MKKALIAMALIMALCSGLKAIVINCKQFVCPNVAKPIENACKAKVDEVQNSYEKIVTRLTNEMNKMNDSNCAYKPNTNVTLPNIDENVMSQAVISGLLGTTTVVCAIDCAIYIHQYRLNCKNDIRNMKSKYQQSIQTIINNINQQYQQCKSSGGSSSGSGDYNGDSSTNGSNTSSNSSNSSSTSGTSGNSSSNSSNYNPYGKGGTSSSSVSGRNSTNEYDFETFRQKVKANANADNNLVKNSKDNYQGIKRQSQSSSQGDTSFYDVVGEKKPLDSNFRDIQ